MHGKTNKQPAADVTCSSSQSTKVNCHLAQLHHCLTCRQSMFAQRTETFLSRLSCCHRCCEFCSNLNWASCTPENSAVKLLCFSARARLLLIWHLLWMLLWSKQSATAQTRHSEWGEVCLLHLDPHHWPHYLHRWNIGSRLLLPALWMLLIPAHHASVSLHHCMLVSCNCYGIQPSAFGCCEIEKSSADDAVAFWQPEKLTAAYDWWQTKHMHNTVQSSVSKPQNKAPSL